MAKFSWERFKESCQRNFMDFLGIFAAEDRFIHEHKNKSSRIAEQNRYGTDEDQKNEQ
jgi:hypothetical protein